MIKDNATGVTVQYPFDPTGTNPECIITNEIQEVTYISSIDSRIVVPTFAPFYVRDLKLSYKPFNSNVSIPLKEGRHYSLGYSYKAATESTLLPVYGIIVINDLSISGVINIERMRIVGGEEALDRDYVLKKLKESTRNPRVAAWEQIVGKPIAFPVIDHEHRLKAFEGTEELIKALENISNSSNEASLEVSEMISNFLTSINVSGFKRLMQDLERHTWSSLLNDVRKGLRIQRTQAERLRDLEKRFLGIEDMVGTVEVGKNFGPRPPSAGVYDYEQLPHQYPYDDKGFTLVNMEVVKKHYYSYYLKRKSNQETPTVGTDYPLTMHETIYGFSKLADGSNNKSKIELQSSEVIYTPANAISELSKTPTKQVVDGFYVLVTTARNIMELIHTKSLTSVSSGNKIYGWGKPGRINIEVPPGNTVWIAPKFRGLNLIQDVTEDNIAGFSLNTSVLPLYLEALVHVTELHLNYIRAVDYNSNAS